MKLNLDFFFYYINREKNFEKIQKEYNSLFLKDSNNESNLRLNIDRVTKVYDNGIKAIDNMSLEINKGEFVVFLGPSGCGKTTLLRIIAGLEKLSDGYLRINNAVINSTVPKDRNLAMVFQNYALYPFMSVFNNIKFGLKNKTSNNSVYNKIVHDIKLAKNSNYDNIKKTRAIISLMKKGTAEEIDEILSIKRLIKVAAIKKDKVKIKKLKNDILNIKNKRKIIISEKEYKDRIKKLKNDISKLKSDGTKNIQKDKIKELINKRRKAYNAWKSYLPKRIDDTLKMLGINMYSNRKPAELSGGQRQRVALARAISKQTNLFLYDEPLSNLDAKLRGKMRSEIRYLHEKMGSTSIYVTHDQIEAMSMADKIVVMNKGYIQQVGTPKDLIEAPNNLFVSKFVGNTDVNIFDAKKMNGQSIKIKDKKIIISNSKYFDSVDWKNIPSFKVVIRPEHIITNKQILSHVKNNKFIGKVLTTEFLGNEILCNLKVEGLGKINALFSNSSNVKRGEEVEISINPNRILLFDNKFGYNILKKLDHYNEMAKETWIKGRIERDKNQTILYRQKYRLSLSQKIIYLIIKRFSKTANEKVKLSKAKPNKEDTYVA